MPQIRITIRANEDLARLSDFLLAIQPLLAERAVATIMARLQKLASFPLIGRVYTLNPKFRELYIPFGKGGYIALYYYSESDNIVEIVAIRHSNEQKYQ